MRLVAIFAHLQLSAVFALAIIFNASTASANANDDGCTADAELVEISLIDLLDASPCTLQGKLYRVGLGVVPEVPFASSEGIEAKAAFYPYFRFYLNENSQTERETSANLTALLLTGVSALPSLEDEDNDAALRGRLYRLFALAEFYFANQEDLQLGGSALLAGLESYQSVPEVPGMHELECFIRFDLVTVPVERILSGDNFLSCVAEETVGSD